MKHLMILIGMIGMIGCDEYSQYIESLDEGLIIRNGVELHVTKLPITISCDEDFDCQAVRNSIQWWQDEFDRHWPVWHDEREMYAITPFDAPQIFEIVDGTAMVRVEEYPLPMTKGGVSSIEYTEDGRILSTLIMMNEGVWDRWMLNHEIGHSFGLEDDPKSLDLNSIMASPVIPYSNLTEHDAYEALKYVWE